MECRYAFIMGANPIFFGLGRMEPNGTHHRTHLLVRLGGITSFIEAPSSPVKTAVTAWQRSESQKRLL